MIKRYDLNKYEIKDDGIEVNMPVIADQGLVGHVISVTNKSLQAQYHFE